MHNPFRDLPKRSGDFRSNPIMRRYAGNPILTEKDVPYPATLVFNAVDVDESRSTKALASANWTKRYTAGAALYDLEDPTKLIAITKEPLLVAETPYETGSPDLYTEFTVFPCGAVLMEDGHPLRVYYGAGDTSSNLAETTLDELWSIMTPCSRLAERATIPFLIEDWRK